MKPLKAQPGSRHVLCNVPLVTSRRALPIWAHLAISALAALLPLWCIVGLGAWIYVGQARTEYEQQTLVLARRLGSELENELSGIGGVLRALATSPALQDGDLQRFHAQALQVVPPGGVIVLRDRTGQQLVNTLFPFGTPLPVTRAAAVIAADQCVFGTRMPCASDLYVGTTDRQPYVLLNAPVFRDGEIPFALNIAFRARHLSELLAGTLVPPDWTASIIDRQDRVIARSREHERFVGQMATAPLRASAQGQEGSFRSVTLEGTPVWAAYVRLPEWGWRVAVGVPEAVLGAPLRQSVLYLGLAGLLAVALSVVTAVIYGRRIARSIGMLSGMAREVGRSAELARVETAIREVNQVGASLVAASATLRRSLAERDLAQAELRRLNDELETRIQAEVAARQEAQASVAHAQRMQALGQLAGGIAHDFNNVLQAARGCAATIEKRAADPVAVRRFARLFLDASQRGVSVTRRLLAFAQQNDLQAEAIDLPTLFSGLQEMLSHTLGTHIAVHVALPPRLPPALADKGQLETVLVNLATNARDAMPGGGSLTFAASVESIADAKAGAVRLDPGTYVRLMVSDTGIGMDEAVLARATEPFFTTKGRGQGNGLGLAMARGFAAQSRGGLRIESSPGQGTTVSLWLPVAEQPAVAVPAAAPPPDRDGAARRPRVLVVEDEDIVRQVLATQLEDEGYEVLSASHAREALDILAQAGGVDALVTDLNMPGMNGLDLIRTVRARGISTAAILLTGNAETGTPLALDGALTQNVALLRKPVLGSDLADRIMAMTTGA